MAELSALSLFSGIGGLDLGLDAAGFSVRLQLDRDRWCARTLVSNRAQLTRSQPVVVQEDIRFMSGWRLTQLAGLKPGEVDLVAGGPPCQSFTSAGNRRGLRDPRGALVWEFLRILEQVRPRAFLFENVPGFGPMAAIWFVYRCARLGYSVSWGLVDSADYGTPQHRVRFVVLGGLGEHPPGLPEPSFGVGAPRRTLRDAIADLGELAYRDGGVKFSPYMQAVLSLVPPGGNWRDLPEPVKSEVAPRNLRRGGCSSLWRRLSWDKPAPTVTGLPDRPMTCLCHPDEVRPLTVREVARLQDLPDSWKLEGSVTARYRHVGNAVPVRLARALGESLARWLQDGGCHARSGQWLGQPRLCGQRLPLGLWGFVQGGEPVILYAPRRWGDAQRSWYDEWYGEEKQA